MSESEQERLEKRQQQRLTFLHKIYQLGGEDECKAVPLNALQQELGLDEATIDRTQRYLAHEKLIDVCSIGGGIENRLGGEEDLALVIHPPFPGVQLTHKGLRAVEQHISRGKDNTRPRKKRGANLTDP